MIVVDTSIVVAYMNAADDHHAAVAGWLDGVDDDLATTPLIVAEVDHLVDARGGPTARRVLHQDLAAGAYLVEWWPGAIAAVVKIAERYADTGLGLADASLVALAETTYGTLFELDRPGAGPACTPQHPDLRPTPVGHLELRRRRCGHAGQRARNGVRSNPAPCHSHGAG